MKKRPNPFLHMATWGFGSGWILAMLFAVILLDVFNGADNGILLLFAPSLWSLTFIFGAIPGVLMGVIVGLALWRMLKDVALPFTQEQMQEKRVQVYRIVFPLTLMLSLLLITIVFGSIFSFLFIPPLIAAVASTYVAHRYMFRLRLWSEQTHTRKSKAKNDALLSSRLSDPSINIEHAKDHDMIETTEHSSETRSS